MKIHHFILASLLAAIAWAKFEGTYAFFAKVKGDLKPLQAQRGDYSSKRMVWGDSLTATEFEYENGFAIFSHESKPANILLGVPHGIRLVEDEPATKLILEEETGRLLNSFYYSCSNGIVSEIEPLKSSKNCFLVEVYFVQYDRETMYPVQGQFKSENIENTPHVFYVTGKHKFEPLYTETLEQDDFSGLVAFHHRKSTVEPVEFFKKGDHAITETKDGYSSYAAFKSGIFGFYRYEGNTSLGLDKNGNVLARRFFSCEDPKSKDHKIVLNPYGCFSWSEVNLSLLPYDRINKEPVKGSFIPSEDVKLTPYALFIREEGTWKSLFFKKSEYSQSSFAFVSETSENEEKPIEFSLQRNIAYTRNTRYPEFVGIEGIDFIFSNETEQTPFDFDDQMKITNHRFSMSHERNILVDIPLLVRLPRVDLYLLPLNRTSGQPAEHSDMSEDDDRMMKVSSVSLMSAATMDKSSESSVATFSEIPESLDSLMSDVPETSVSTKSHISESSFPTLSEIPQSSASSMSHITETSISSISDIPDTSVITMSDTPESSILTMSDIPETSAITMSDTSESPISSASEILKSSASSMSYTPESSIQSMSEIPKTSVRPISDTPQTSIPPVSATLESSVLAMSDIPQSSIPSMSDVSETSVLAMPHIPESSAPIMSDTLDSSILSMFDISESSVLTMSHIPKSSVSNMVKSSESSVSIIADTSSSLDISNSSRSSTSMSAVADESAVDEPSKWMATTLTRDTTSTATVCTECQAAPHIIVRKTYTDFTTYCSEKTTFTVTVCEGPCHPSTVTVTTATTLTITGVCIVPETTSGGDSGLKGVAEAGKVRNSAQKGAADTVAKESHLPKGPEETPFAPDSAKKTGKVNDSAPKPSKESNVAEPTFDSSDVTNTRILTGTITTPSVSLFVNGASKNAIGACIVGFVALLL